MRTLVVALGLALACVGCLQQGTVRATLVEESIVLGPTATDAARKLAEPFDGCTPGDYDPERKIIRFAPRDYVPRFAVVVPIEGRYSVMAAGSGGPYEVDLGVLDEVGASGAWSWGSPFGSADFAELTWGREGATFAGVPLREGEPVERTWRYEAHHENASFWVEHTFRATYLGRLAFDESYEC